MTDLLSKKRIRNCFNKASITYDNHCQIQKKICLDSLKLLTSNKFQFNLIADIACGTGVSTKFLTNKIRYKKCYAVDIAKNLLFLAKEKNLKGNIEYILADFDNVIFTNEKLDFIFCNMGLQWSLDISNTLNHFNSYLSTNGLLLFSIPVLGTFAEIKSNSKNQMCSLEYIKNILWAAKFDIKNYHIKTYCQEFNSPYEALKSIKNTGADCLLVSKNWQPIGLSRNHINNIFIKLNSITLTYKIAFIIAKKIEGTIK